jgi:hypothetical protein
MTGTRATKIDASAGLLRKVNKKLDTIIEMKEILERILEIMEHNSSLAVKEMMNKQRGMTRE